METKILIVDDDDAHRQMLSAVLSEEGYEVHQADDGSVAVELSLHPRSGWAQEAPQRGACALGKPLRGYLFFIKF